MLTPGQNRVPLIYIEQGGMSEAALREGVPKGILSRGREADSFAERLSASTLLWLPSLSGPMCTKWLLQIQWPPGCRGGKAMPRIRLFKPALPVGAFLTSPWFSLWACGHFLTAELAVPLGVLALGAPVSAQGGTKLPPE